MHRYYGFHFTSPQDITLNETEAAAVRLIFSEYLAGHSLGYIADQLQARGFLSPTGKEIWSRSSVDNILTKGYYIPAIISFEDFTAAQFERQARSNINEATGKRKATRYHSKNELSGLFICQECGASYRRITRHSGKVVWRCANRVEHGKKICNAAPTITEEHIDQFLHALELDTQYLRKQTQSLEVHSDGRLTVLYPEQTMEPAF